jgi:hypothetical protein
LLHPFGDSCISVESGAQSSFGLDSLPSTAGKRLIQGAQHRIKKMGAKVVKLSVNPDAKSTKSGLKFETSDR